MGLPALRRNGGVARGGNRAVACLLFDSTLLRPFKRNGRAMQARPPLQHPCRRGHRMSKSAIPPQMQRKLAAAHKRWRKREDREFFTPVPRPKGFRLGKAKECHANACRIAIDGHGQYVEGYAGSNTGLLFRHAWITTDGNNAIEVTWRDPGARYFDIVCDTKDVYRAAFERGAFEPMFPDLPVILAIDL
jgi:hypothetical protein